MKNSSLLAISPLDGRYASIVDPIREHLSEYALIRSRVKVEVEWLINLLATPQICSKDVDPTPIRTLIEKFSPQDAEEIKIIEQETNHDVKAVEYWMKHKLEKTHIKEHLSLIHFGCTSADINNVAYGLMLKNVRDCELVPAYQGIIDCLREKAICYAEQPMLSRTHGQPASPTTLGKEMAVFAQRLERQIKKMRDATFDGKMNGAVGNYSAHISGFPSVDWPGFSQRFIESLGLSFNSHTTQIEAHDGIAEFFGDIQRSNCVIKDLCQDMWLYISLNYFTLPSKPKEVGSSTMPHKVNPIDFENAEGNIGIANAVLGHLSEKLTISRLQRDLSDSTAIRNVGVGIGHSLIACHSTSRGLEKIVPNPKQMAQELDHNWQVLAEAIVSAMKAHGTVDAYEQLKKNNARKGIHECQCYSCCHIIRCPS